MQLSLKILLTVAVVLTATAVARRTPSLGGLIGVMPLTGALVLIWTYLENQRRPEVVQELAKGALWGIGPSILFFVAAVLLLQWNVPFPLALVGGFACWLAGALAHQLLLG
jgi:uncharacterized membrane protein (GlpM family)